MRHAQLPGGLAMLLFLCACNDGTGPEESRIGRYELMRINGMQLPALLTEGNTARIDFLDGAIHLNDDATFTDSSRILVTPKTGTGIHIDTDVAEGVYHISNDTVFLHSTRNERYFMVYLSHNSLQQELSGSILLYAR